MKRDMDLVRSILQRAESCNDPFGLHEEIDIEGYSQNEISYHIKLLNDAGLLDAMDISAQGEDGFRWWPGSLTWDGQEFLNAAKDDSIWKKAKEKFMVPTMTVTFDLLLDYLKTKTKEKFGL
jgi:DNA-binding transcriptional ArsR family regulator